MLVMDIGFFKSLRFLFPLCRELFIFLNELNSIIISSLDSSSQDARFDYKLSRFKNHLIIQLMFQIF
ncbi:hypothetical protein KFK09_023947 [Dendrobium nobile]|uniref:Uncharacterized protein n=1 Tax=Dendrobium nobile TaxID=94219 RepID=A0A8T3ADG0_DENNO|nr:hypothetical protein KFK09_023947 [Dendrobium nobile]